MVCVTLMRNVVTMVFIVILIRSVINTVTDFLITGDITGRHIIFVPHKVIALVAGYVMLWVRLGPDQEQWLESKTL